MLQTSKTRSSSPPKKLDLNKNRYSALKRITPGKAENEPNETSPKTEGGVVKTIKIKDALNPS